MEKETVNFLLEKYLAGTLSEAEKNELADHINSKQNKEFMIGVMDDFITKQGAVIDFDEKRFMPLLAGIFSADARDDDTELTQEPEIEYSQPGLSRAKKLWLLVIGLLIIAAASFYFLYYRHLEYPKSATQSPPPKQSNEVKPGSYKAILTRADGTKLALERAAIGSLGQQGNAKLGKTSANEIKYTATGLNNSLVLSNTITTPKGGQFQVTLSDGSRVTLNANSSITYPVAFAGTERIVTISGEAFFEVTASSKKPFIVSVFDMKVEVVGTVFNINAYFDEPFITIALLKGSIKITKDSISHSLRPLQEAQFEKEGTFSLKKNIDTSEVVAWKNGLFKFNKSDIESVTRQLGRWYDVDVEFENNAPRDLLVSAKIQRNADFADCIRLLKLNRVNSRLEGKTLIVMP